MSLMYRSENKCKYAHGIELSFSKCFCFVSGVKEKKTELYNSYKIIFLHFISSTSFVPEIYSKWRIGQNIFYILTHLLDSLLALLTCNWTITWHITHEAGTLTEHLQGWSGL